MIKKYEKHFIGTVKFISSYQVDIICKKLVQEKIYKEIIIFKDENNLEAINELNLNIGDKVKLGIYKKHTYYHVDVLDRA